jgi:hypothetical protein
MDKSYAAIMSALAPEYQGFVENPDQLVYWTIGRFHYFTISRFYNFTIGLL